MLAADDSYAYWQSVDTSVPIAKRAAIAFENRWFGTKSEARVRVILRSMVERFEKYPEALALLHELRSMPSSLRPLICHTHTQLADPIYRKFTGDFLPMRRSHGHATVDREIVARWIDTLEPGRWSATTCIKFGSNLLATAYEAGLVSDRRDPRKTALGSIPDSIFGYVLYLLRGVEIEGTLTDNAYLRSLGVTLASFHSLAPRIPGIRFAELGGVVDLTFVEPSLTAWGRKYLGSST
jgi:hypothetical protein